MTASSTGAAGWPLPEDDRARPDNLYDVSESPGTVVAAFAYPWDVLGDPAAPGRLRDLGVDTVVLAAAYHSTTAVTPRHPDHRVVHAPHSAVYYPPDPARWGGATLRPAPQRWCGAQDAYGSAASQLRDAGLDVHAWVVLAHNSLLAQAHQEHAVRNAYGDHYGWALCIAQPQVRTYAATLAAEAASRPGTGGVELEACGWYGHAHLHAHDKTSGMGFREAAQYLLSLCFCPACQEGYASCGIDPGRLRTAVSDALAPLWRGKPERPDEGDGCDGDDWAAVRALLGRDLADATLRYRLAAARDFQGAVVAAVRSEAGPGCRVVLHADPVPHRTGANPGVAVADFLAAPGAAAPRPPPPPPPAPAGSVPAGIVVPAGSVPSVGPLLRGTVLAANHQIVSAVGGSPDFTPSAAATEIRLYHPGLASSQDLRAAAAAVARYRASRPYIPHPRPAASRDAPAHVTPATTQGGRPPWNRS
jgi:hypothetical protein